MDDTFKVNDKGVLKEATKITVVSISGVRYLLYSIKNTDNTSLLVASKIIKDESGNDKLVKVDDEGHRLAINKFIESLVK